MTTPLRLAFAAAPAAALAAPRAIAQSEDTPAPGQMMQATADQPMAPQTEPQGG
jgi:hypothetical protein